MRTQTEQFEAVCRVYHRLKLMDVKPDVKLCAVGASFMLNPMQVGKASSKARKDVERIYGDRRGMRPAILPQYHAR